MVCKTGVNVKQHLRSLSCFHIVACELVAGTIFHFTFIQVPAVGTLYFALESKAIYTPTKIQLTTALLL